MFSGIRALIFVCMLGLSGTLHAHGDESHSGGSSGAGSNGAGSINNSAAGPAQQSAAQAGADGARGDVGATAPVAQPATAQQHDAAKAAQSDGPGITISAVLDDLTWSEFPTLHPMVVHVPVTLIPLALVFSLLALFAPQRLFVWLALALAAVGLAAGYVAAFPAHPHTSGLPQAAELTLRKHDFFAYTTLWLTLAAVVVAALCLLKPLRPAKLGLSLVLLLATLSVSLTGHYGGTLAYVHGIGAQGRYLSTH